MSAEIFEEEAVMIMENLDKFLQKFEIEKNMDATGE